MAETPASIFLHSYFPFFYCLSLFSTIIDFIYNTILFFWSTISLLLHILHNTFLYFSLLIGGMLSSSPFCGYLLLEPAALVAFRLNNPANFVAADYR